MNLAQRYKKQCPVRDNILVERNIPIKSKSRRDDILWFGKISHIGKMLRTYGTLFSSGQPVFYQYLIPNGIMNGLLNNTMSVSFILKLQESKKSLMQQLFPNKNVI